MSPCTGTVGVSSCRPRRCLLGALAAGLALFTGTPVPQRPAGETRAASILITDRTGRTLYEVIDPNGSKQMPVPLAEIPLACRNATIATEDSRFYAHPGVDLLGIARALWQNWRTGERDRRHQHADPAAGAQPLPDAEAERAERTLRRKLREAWLAWRLERTYSKDELLALYLNTTYYGHFATGIEAAAQAYFGVHARELDLAQCALLAGLPQSPTAYNPIENLEGRAEPAGGRAWADGSARLHHLRAGRARPAASGWPSPPPPSPSRRRTS